MNETIAMEVLGGSLTKGELKKIEILEAAISCIANDGIEATTFDAIGQKIGIRRAHVAYHFPNKDDIIEAAIKFVAKTAQSEIALHVDFEKPKGLIRNYIKGNYSWLRKYPQHASVLLLFYYYSSYNKRYLEIHRQIRKVGLERIKQILILSYQARLSDDELHVIAKTVQNLIIGFIVDALTLDASLIKSYQMLKKQIDHYLEVTFMKSTKR